MKRLYLVLGIFCLIYSTSMAQEKWNLQKCIDYSLTHNIQAQQADLNIALAKSKKEQSMMGMLPSLNGSANNMYNYGRTIDQYAGRFVNQQTRTNNLFLSSNLTVFDGFQLQNTRRQSEFDLQASKKDAEQARNDIALNVIANYLQVLYNSEFLKIIQNTKLATEKQLRRVELLVNAGALPLGNKLDLEAQVANDELNEVNAQNRLDLSYLDLAQAMNFDSISQLLIEKPNLSSYQYTILEINPSDIYQVALANQPAIVAGEYKIRSAQAGLAMARGSRSPRLSMSGTYGSGFSDAQQRIAGYQAADSTLLGYFSNTPIYITPERGDPILEKTPFNTQMKDNLNRSFGFTLSVPLFNGWASKAAIDRSKINLENTRLNFEQSKIQLNKTIRQTHADAIAALRKYNAASKSLQAVEESFKYIEQKFALGAVNSLEFLAAKNNVEKAKSDLLQSQYEYIFKTKILDFYLGKTLTF